MIEFIVESLTQVSINVQMFFHYFAVYFCVYLLHEDKNVSKLSLCYALVLFLQMIPVSDSYFFHKLIFYESVIVLLTFICIRGKRLQLLLTLSSFSIIMNALMMEFPYDLSFLYTYYSSVNRVLLETTLAALLYDHKSKKRNLVIFLIMILIYTHEF